MKNHTDPVQSPKELLSELQSLVAEAETMMADSASEHSADAMETIRARFEATQERFSDLYTGAKKKITAGAKATDKAIRENPYQSIAIAAGLGLLIGVLVGRRNE